MQWGNLNIETEKSEQTVFAHISCLNFKIFTVWAVKRFKDCNTNWNVQNICP